MNQRLSQFLTLILAGACGILLLLVVAFWFGLGRGYSWWSLDEADAAALNDGKLNNTQFKLPAWESFAEVNARPLFNEDRKPTPPIPPDVPVVEQKPIAKLNAVLSGVIITPKMHLALIKENGKEKSISVKEGTTLAGDLSAWTLLQVKPRGVVFKNTAGETISLELVSVPSSQKPTPPTAPMPAPPVQPAAPGAAAAPDATAELQQRIDARRQQIRDQQGQPPPQHLPQPQDPPQAQQQR